MAVESKRGCGYRKVGALYLCADGAGQPCDRLPFPLTVCPTCSAGIKQARGWTWIAVAGLVGGIHCGCKDDFPCPLCMATEQMGRAGLLWIGERFYKTPQVFEAEATALGISRRITTVPRDFKLGETWVLLAHPKCISVDALDLRLDEPDVVKPGIFRVFRPQRVEKIITESQSKDAEAMADLAKRGITPVVVPDDDPDHRGSVYDKEPEAVPLLEGQVSAPAG